MTGSSRWRIGVTGISIECSTFSPVPTTYEDFAHYRGDEIFNVYPFLGEAGGVVPLQWSRSIPGGPVSAASYERMRNEILDTLSDGAPWDGMYLIMHGAMNVAGIEDAEGDFVARVRSAVGRACTVFASYDLHGNMSMRIFDAIDLITAYRHAPHIDAEETRRRGFELLLSNLEHGKRPHKRWDWLPLLLPGEKTSTEWEPGRSLYQEIDTAVALPGILDASVLVGYAWADEPRSGASVLTYGDNPDVVESECMRIATRFWNLRDDFDFGVPAGTFADCLGRALADIQDGIHPVIISDSGDNPTAGGVGDVTGALERLLRVNPEGAVFASICDVDAVARCFKAGEGTRVSLRIGGKLDRNHGTPLECSGNVAVLSSVDPKNRHAVIRCGDVLVILTEKRTPFHHIDQFLRLSIDPTGCPLVVVKIGYLVPELKSIAKRSYLALTPGAVDQHIVNLPYRHVRRPIFPLDIDATRELHLMNDRES